METASPPVSPKVVASTLMIQNVRVTSGTLLSTHSLAPCALPAGPLLFISMGRCSRTFSLQIKNHDEVHASSSRTGYSRRGCPTVRTMLFRLRPRDAIVKMWSDFVFDAVFD